MNTKTKTLLDTDFFKDMAKRFEALGISPDALSADYDPEENRRIGEREATESRKRKRAENLLNLAIANIPPKFADATLDNWQTPTAEHTALLAKVRRIFEYQVTLMIGETKRGKSHILHALSKEAAREGMVAGYFRWAQIAAWFSRPFSPATATEFEKSPFDRILDMDKYYLLMIDDFNADELPPHVLKQLFELIDHRESYELPTVMVSNMTRENVVQAFGFFWNKINSRLMEGNGQFIDFNTIPEWRASVNK